MKTLEIVFGNSCYLTMMKSKLNVNDILMINILLNVGDISNINNYKINIPKELCLDNKNNNVKEEVAIIIDNIKQKNKIRIWTSKKEVYSYLIMLFVSNIIKEYNYELYVVYSDDYNKKCASPSSLREDELEELSNYEQKLSEKEIEDNAKLWKKLVEENSEFRVLENGKVKSVSIDYYDNIILDNLRIMGKVKMVKLVAKIMREFELQDILFVYFIERLIKKDKIKIYHDNSIRYFENQIEIKQN